MRELLSSNFVSLCNVKKNYGIQKNSLHLEVFWFIDYLENFAFGHAICN